MGITRLVKLYFRMYDVMQVHYVPSTAFLMCVVLVGVMLLFMTVILLINHFYLALHCTVIVCRVSFVFTVVCS